MYDMSILANYLNVFFFKYNAFFWTGTVLSAFQNASVHLLLVCSVHFFHKSFMNRLIPTSKIN